MASTPLAQMGFPYRDYLTGMIIPVEKSLWRSGSKLCFCRTGCAVNGLGVFVLTAC
jgi:hypothetical protein